MQTSGYVKNLTFLFQRYAFRSAADYVR